MAKKKRKFTLNVIIEIPKGSRNKYEYDPERKCIKFDRMLFSAMHYPSDYGFIPKTLAGDGDTLDALVLVTEPTFPGCLIEAKPIGLFKMWDEKGPDEKSFAYRCSIRSGITSIHWKKFPLTCSRRLSISSLSTRSWKKRRQQWMAGKVSMPH